MTAFGTGIALGPGVSFAATPQPYTPMSEGGLVAWFDMLDQRAYTLSGGVVSTVTNKATGVAWGPDAFGLARTPGFNPVGISGRPAMTFDQNNPGGQRFINTEAPVVASQQNNSPGTVVCVAQSGQLDFGGSIFGAGNSGTASQRVKRYGFNTGGVGQFCIAAVDDAGTGLNLLSNSGTSTLASFVASWSYSSSLGTIASNGVQLPGAIAQAYAPGTLTVNQVAIGCRPDSGPDSFWDGAVGELLVFNQQLSDEALARVTVWLCNKWGIPCNPLTFITSVTVTQWIRADQGITQVTGVSQWNDLSGNGHNFAQGTGSQQPAYNAADATLNGRPTVTADGSNDTLVNNTISNGPGAWQSGIIRMNAWGNFKVVWGGPAVGDANDFLSQGSSPQLSMFSGSSVNFSTGLAVGQWGRAEMHWNGVSSYLKLRSTTVSGGNPGSGSSTGCALFSSTNIGFGPYSIAERVMCSGKPTAWEIAMLDAYFAALYGQETVQ